MDFFDYAADLAREEAQRLRDEYRQEHRETDDEREARLFEAAEARAINSGAW